MRRSLRRRLVPAENEALKILRRMGCPPNVVAHCERVADIAVELALKALDRGFPVDLRLIEAGALLHDIGRSVTHGVDHGVIGAEIVRSLGLDEEVARIVERHVGAGIPAEEAAGLGLPRRDYIPSTLEEKIVCYADKLARGSQRMSYKEALKEFMEILGKDHPAIERFKRLHKEILTLIGNED